MSDIKVAKIKSTSCSHSHYNIVFQVRIFQTIRLEESSRSLLVYSSNNSLVTRARLGVAMAPDLHPYKCLPGRYFYKYIYAYLHNIYTYLQASRVRLAAWPRSLRAWSGRAGPCSPSPGTRSSAGGASPATGSCGPPSARWGP